VIAPTSVAPRVRRPLPDDRQALVGDHYKLALKLAHRSALRFPGGVDSAIDSATSGLIAAGVKFDPTWGITFATFAIACIRKRLRYDPREQYHSQDALQIAGPFSVANEPQARPEVEPDDGAAFTAITASLEPRYREVLWLRLVEELDFPRIASAIGATPRVARGLYWSARWQVYDLGAPGRAPYDPRQRCPPRWMAEAIAQARGLEA